MTQIRFKFECGCVNSQTVRSRTEKGSARRFCPKHPTSPAIEKIYTCAICNIDVIGSIHSGGPGPKRCPACLEQIKRQKRREKYARQIANRPGKQRRGGSGYYTTDEIYNISTWKKSSVQSYLEFIESEHGQRRDWGDIDPVAVREACVEILEGVDA
jgi:hypothetical protein